MSRIIRDSIQKSAAPDSKAAIKRNGSRPQAPKRQDGKPVTGTQTRPGKTSGPKSTVEPRHQTPATGAEGVQVVAKPRRDTKRQQKGTPGSSPGQEAPESSGAKRTKSGRLDLSDIGEPSEPRRSVKGSDIRAIKHSRPESVDEESRSGAARKRQEGRISDQDLAARNNNATDSSRSKRANV